jgi:pimeloyl-ACP methyl ester carboxylesterase
LDPNDPVDKPVFWNFDFEDMGTKDVPAFIDYILEETGQEKLTYIGHSEGTTQMFIGASLIPDYFKSKLNLYVALAPATRIGHVKSTMLRILASNVQAVEKIIINDFGMYNFIAPSWIMEEVTANFCAHNGEICAGFLELYADLDPSVDNLERVRTYMSHFPSGAGFRCSIHYAQIINSNRF